VTKLPNYHDFGPKRKYERRLRQHIESKAKDQYDELAISLLESLLTLNPNRRLSASEALQHPIF